MAAFCVGTGMPPEVYLGLTVLERQAFINRVNQVGKRR